MGKFRSSEWCGVPYCPSASKVKGLCGSHYKDHMNKGVFQELVANDEVSRSFLKQPAYSPSYYARKHRTFAATLPIPKHQQVALTQALNATALRQGVVK